MKKQQTINTFSNLVFHAMPVPNVGCIATGKLTSGYDITVTGGNHGQAADGVESFLVEVIDAKSKSRDGEVTSRILVKKNMSRDDLTFYIEHHRRRKPRRHHRR